MKRAERKRLELSKETLRRLNTTSLDDEKLRTAAGGQAATNFDASACAVIGDLTLNGCRGPSNTC
ncbi:MAG: hypothetical protein M3217_07455 [Actinomycetota bacterium]|nr:hypothetical protein [Actinomycetota bacterium]